MAAVRKAGARWLGVGLAAVLAVVTIGLAVTGRLQLYINPAQTWFAVGMAVLALAGTVWSFALPLGAEADHGHDHGPSGAHDHGGAAHAHAHHARVHGPADGHHPDQHVSIAAGNRPPYPPGVRHAEGRHGAGVRGVAGARRVTGTRRVAGAAAVVVGGVAASAVAVAALVLPPASLSVELAMDRDTGTPPLFAGADTVTLAASGDTSGFGIGEWSTVFATATNPDAYAGKEVTLTGFVTPDEESPDGVRLGRLVITHCVIDAQPASVPVSVPEGTASLAVGEWIEVTGTIAADASGALSIEPETITAVDAPEDPYEY
ncbi:TIGR03943 family protein [Microbacterium barkeri]|uniref:TIGR03943 family putative permease subunit n=1 Tax=Microbacterium barkeri TaxID=33917 RepID=UPI0024AFB894|nr:TIGR03943 family protein [Microbacterium barkeri]MDI6942930.1 TIGR03943 family protein [Microbacterium barkeri]